MIYGGLTSDYYSAVTSQVVAGIGGDNFYYNFVDDKNICYDGNQASQAEQYVDSIQSDLFSSIDEASETDKSFDSIPAPYNKVVERDLKPRF